MIINDFAIAHAGPDDDHIVAEVTAEALQHTDIAHWLVPDDHARRHVLRDVMLIWASEALHRMRGLIDITTDLQAVAIWNTLGTCMFTPSTTPYTPENYDTRLPAACGPYTSRFRLLHQTLTHHHPSDTPHHHLAFFAVVPRFQRQGRGAALLNQHHTEFAHTPTYAEATTPQARTLYLQHEYRDCGAPVDLPENGPRIWPMWRTPRP